MLVSVHEVSQGKLASFIPDVRNFDRISPAQRSFHSRPFSPSYQGPRFPLHTKDLNIMLQQSVTCLLFSTLRSNWLVLHRKPHPLWIQALVITVEAYVSLPMFPCLEAWTPLRPFFSLSTDLTFSSILYGSIGQGHTYRIISVYRVLSNFLNSVFQKGIIS